MKKRIWCNEHRRWHSLHAQRACGKVQWHRMMLMVNESLKARRLEPLEATP